MSVIAGLERAEGFTEAERDLASFILSHADEVTRMSITCLAEQAYSSNATAIRLSRKLGASGWRDFRVLLASDLEKRRSGRTVSDASVPFQEGEGPSEVMSSLAMLHKDAVDDTYASVDAFDVDRAARIVRQARRIFVFAGGDSRISAMAFSNMAVKMGVTVIIADQYGDALANASSAMPGDAALVISYSGKILDAPEMKKIMRLMQERRCRIVWMSGAEKPLAADVGLRLPSREGKTGKIATFYSQACVRYLLNCIYGAVWSLDYEGNAGRQARLDDLDASVSPDGA